MSLRKSLKVFTLLAVPTLCGATPALAATSEDPDPHLIVVQGSGEVRVEPDSLRLDVGVEVRAKTIADAREQVNAGMRRVIDAVRALSLPDLALETSILQVTPVYAPQQANQPPRISGYAASNHVTITLRDVAEDVLGDRGASILDAALGAGANSVGGLEFFLADPSSARDEALAAAVRDARRDAATIATAAGVTLSSLHSVEEETGVHVVPRAMSLQAMASTPVEVGDVVVQSSVTARFLFQ